jgi:hypothetical protein
MCLQIVLRKACLAVITNFNGNKMNNLTSKEAQVLKAIAKGMDQPGEGYFYEINPLPTKEGVGVLGSLVKKELATVEGHTTHSYVIITETGKAVARELGAWCTKS